MSLKWWSLTGKERVPFHIQIWAGRNERAERLLGLADNPQCPYTGGWSLNEGQMEARRRGNGALRQRSYCLTCQPGVLMALVSCWRRQDVWPAVLISQRCVFFSSTFLFFFHTRCHLTVDHRQGLVGQPAVSVTNCHQHCLSSLTGWTDDGHLNGRRCSNPSLHLYISTKPQRIEKSSIFIPSPTSSLLFCVFRHSYVKAEIKHMVLICNKSTVTQADFLLRIFSVSY